jgi:hypothetical protein
MEESKGIIQGTQYPLKCVWNLWIHDSTSTDWTLASYSKIYDIPSIGHFWSYMNNFSKYDIGKHHMFIMRDGIYPIWEDKINREGGICSIKVDIAKSFDLWRDIVMYGMNEALLPTDEITGFSYCATNNNRNVIIRIWTKTKNDICKFLHRDIINTYGKLSIRYKENKPQY